MVSQPTIGKSSAYVLEAYENMLKATRGDKPLLARTPEETLAAAVLTLAAVLDHNAELARADRLEDPGGF